jgi:hypothetical protein
MLVTQNAGLDGGYCDDLGSCQHCGRSLFVAPACRLCLTINPESFAVPAKSSEAWAQ